ncbi:hypothetical protein LYZ91_14155, partial [Xanthomonas hortorum pv. vitians]|nr:hypothetical protein [Xanthomonas hortorum pv. vitians]MCE4367560.1 hypothetical protein [Xanthomonas hortorum pv. vitians]
EDLPASLLALAQALSVTERQLHGSLLNMGVVSLICGALFRGSLALVAAGYGIGLASGAKLEPCKHSDIVIRPLANQAAVITTYMLKAASAAPSISVDRFTTRLKDRN